MPRTILIVDDDEMNRHILRSLLSAEYSVIEAENGEDALKLLAEAHQKISAMLLDIVMPVMDGYAVLEKRSQNPAFAQIPVVIITGNGDSKAEKQALALGANDFVVKPFDVDILKRRLSNLVGLRESAAMVNALQRDPLTGVWNRDAFFQKASLEIPRKPEGYFILACVDIDNFKVINDRYGSEKGDEILRKLAGTMQKYCSVNGGICGRIAADNFISLFPQSFVDKKLVGPHLLEEGLFQIIGAPVSISIGRYVVNDKSLSVGAMYDRAKLAQNTVKGRYDVHVANYDESMRKRLVREQEITVEMRKALATGQFEAWYQPQYNHATGALIGAEALARWRHPQWGLVSPGEFIPVFERNGFIYELDKCIWEQTCASLRRWIDAGRSPLPVSVNISRCDLFRSDLIDVILGLVKKYAISEELLRLEITESAFAESSRRVIDMVKQLVKLGFTVEIDDFGSGYSSLNTLKDVPAQIIKLDMRFLESSDNLDRGGNIIESIVRMSKWLGMSVIAEGVEKAAQADYLKSIGCSYVQGYLYARPMPSAEYEALAKNAGKEERLIRLETVEKLDNNAFWNPESLDTLIFNSYVGAACIFEYRNGKIELLRATEKFAAMLGSRDMSMADMLKLDWISHLDEQNSRMIAEAIRKSAETKDEVTCEYLFLNLPGCPEKNYIRAAFRVIATAGERRLVYNVIENTTARREAEQKRLESELKEQETAAQLSAIMENIDSGISAVTFDDSGTVRFVFANKRYYSILGYTREQFEEEVENAFDLVFPEDRERIQKIAIEVLRNKRNDSYKYRCVKRDGSIVYLRCYATFTRIAGISGAVQLSVISDITKIAEAEQKILDADAQLKFLNDVSADLLGQPEIEVGIDRVLHKILDYFNAERAYIIEQDEKRQVFNNTFEVCAPGVKSEMTNLQGLPYSVYSGWLRAFESGDYIDIDNVSALPDHRAEERVTLEAQGIKSLIAVPFHRDGRLVGFIGVDDPVRGHEQVKQLQALGDYLAVMLTRRDLMARIKNDQKMLQNFMDDTPGGFARMQLLPDGRILTLYANKVLCQLRRMTCDELMAAEGENAMANVHPDDRAYIGARIASALRSGRSCQLKYRLRGGDGVYAWFSVFGRLTCDERGNRYLNVYYTDVAEQERKGLTLRESMPFILSAIMENSPDLAFAKDRDFRYICCSPAFARSVGRKGAGEVIGRTDFDLYPPESAQRFRRDDEKLFESGESLIDVVGLIPSDDGIQHYSSTSKYILRDSSGEIIGLYGCGRDVTDVRSAFERLRLLNDNIPGGLASYEIGPVGLRNLYVNDGICAMMDYTRQEYEAMVAENALCLVFDEDLPILAEQIDKLRRGENLVDCVFRIHKKGSGYIWCNMRGAVAGRRGDKATVNVVLFDVTKAKLAEEALRVREESMRIAISQMGRMICEYDPATRVLVLPEPLAARYGVQPVLQDVPDSVARGSFINKAFYPDYIGFYNAILRGEKSGSMEYQGVWADGTPHWMRMEFSSIFNSDGKPAKTIIAIEETTEKKKTEEMLNISRTFLDVTGNIVRTMLLNLSSQKIEQESGSPQEWFSTRAGSQDFDSIKAFYVKNCVYEEDTRAFSEFFSFQNALLKYKGGISESSIEYRRRDQNGTLRWLCAKAHVTQEALTKDIKVYLVFSDITDSKNEYLLIREQATLDPLTGILNRAAFAVQADRLIGGLPGGAQSALLMLDLDGFKMLNDTFGHAAGDQALIEVAASLRSELSPDDVLGRLGGDEFLIYLADVQDDEAVARRAKQLVALLRRAYSVEVHISASVGIAVSPRDGRNFDALYHRADAALYSVKESGKDNFMFYQPEMGIKSHHADKHDDLAALPARTPAAKRRMLVVDDSEESRAMLTALFKDDFIVDTASDGSSALARLRHYGSAISVVLLDLVMPGLDGFGVLQKMQSSAEMRLVPVIVVSSLDDAETNLRTIRLGASDFITKPVDAGLIRLRVKSAVSKAENERLRAQNSFLRLQNDEVAKYRAALESAGAAVVEYNWKSGAFVYDPSLAQRIAGSFDNRGLWQILLSDSAADASDVQEMQNLTQRAARGKSGGAIVTLKTPSNARHRFRVNVNKMANASQPAEKCVLTFIDLDAAEG